MNIFAGEFVNQLYGRNVLTCKQITILHYKVSNYIGVFVLCVCQPSIKKLLHLLNHSNFVHLIDASD